MIDPILVPILINKLSKRVNTFDKDELKKFNLSKIHVLYILVLARMNEGMTLKEITEYIGFDKANTTRVMKHLLEVGYVQKENNIERKHKYKVFITEKGKEVADAIVRSSMGSSLEILSVLTEEELHSLSLILNKINDVL